MSRKSSNNKNKRAIDNKIRAAVKHNSPFEGLRREQHLRRLEPRIMFDGAAVATIDGAAVATIDVAATGADAGQDASAPVLPDTNVSSNNNSSPVSSNNENTNASQDDSETVLDDAVIDGTGEAGGARVFIFIDPAVSDPASIIAAADPRAVIYILDPESDGLNQIASVLADEADVDAVHIISHGSTGQLVLAGKTYDANDLADHASNLAIIGNALSEDGDILLYGCNVASNDDGIQYLDTLAALTGADIAASDDDTGSSVLGGDWDLEVKAGAVEATLLSAPSWDALLAPLEIEIQPNSSVIQGSNGLGQQTFLIENAGSSGATSIDIRATVTSATAGANISIYPSTGPINYGGDDILLVMNAAGTVEVKWEIFESGTNQTVYAFGDPNFSIADLDGFGSGNPIERVSPNLAGLTGYVLDSPTTLEANVSGGVINVGGTAGRNGQPDSMVQFQWSNVSSWEVSYFAAAGGRHYLHDGDGDFTFINPQTTFLLGIDLDDNNSTATGTAFNAAFTEGGPAVSVVDSDVTITQHVALGTSLDSAHVTLSNVRAGDVLSVGALPNAIAANIDTSVAGEITVTLAGNASVADYQTALRAISFTNTSNAPDTADRNITIEVTNDAFGTTSNSGLSTIQIVPVNDAPSGADNTISAGEDSPHTFTTANFGFSDVDGDALQSVIITTLPDAAEGMLTLNGNPVSAGDEIAAAQITNLVFTPATDVNGNGLGSLTFQVKDDGGTANNGQDTDQSPNTINFNIAPGNDAPIADDENFNINEDSGPVAIDLLTGDTDPDGDTLSVQSINGTNVTPGIPQAIAIPGGTVNVDAAGNVTFTPAANYSGAINFDYVVSDGNGGTDTGSVSGTVNGAPTIDLDDISGLSIVPGQNGFTALSFSDPVIANDGQTEEADGIGNGETATYSNVGTINGQAIDFIATVIRVVDDPNELSGVQPQDGENVKLNANGAAGNKDNANANFGGNSAGTDKRLAVEIRWQAVIAGTTTPITGDFAVVLSDLDKGNNATKFEEIAVDVSSLDGFTFGDTNGGASSPTGSDLQVRDAAGNVIFEADDAPESFDPTGLIRFTPTDADPGVPGERPDNSVQLNFTNTSNFTVIYNRQDAGGNIGMDGNFTSPFFGSPVSVDTNPDFANIFTEDGPAIAISSDRISINDDGQIAGATITLTNAQASDLLHAPSGAGLPAGITIDPASSATNIILAGTASTADYETAINAITFENTSQNPNGSIDRIIEISLTDDVGLNSNVATATIEVVPVNDAPVAIDDGPVVIIGGTPINVDVLNGVGAGASADSDVDGDALTVTHIIDPANPGTPLAISIGNPVTLASGTIVALQANSTLDVTTPLTSTGAESFGYTISDGNGGTDNATVTFDRTSGNSDPVAQDDTIAATEDTPVSGNVLGNNGGGIDTDADGDTLNVTGFTVAGDATPYAPGDTATIPNIGTLTIASNGAFTFTPALNYFGPVPKVTYTISDGNGGTDAADLALGPVISVNDAPIADDESVTTDEDTPVTINVLDGDTDVDGTIDPATVGVEDPANPGTYLTSLTEVGVGTWTVDTAPASPTFGQITFTPVAHYNGAVTPISYQVADNDGATTTALVNVTLNSVNDAPIADDETFNIDEDSGPVAIDLLYGDTDADGDILSVQSINGTNVTPGAPQAIAIPNGTVNIDASGNVTFTPALNYFGPINFDYVVSDGTGLTDTGSVSGIVNSVNDQPVNSIALGDQSANDGEPVSISTFGGFTDADGDSLTFSLDPGTPAWLSIHPTTGVVTGTPPANASQGGPVSNGEYPVTVIVTDPDGATAQDVFNLKISNPTPVANDDAASLGEDDNALSGNVITDAITGDADTAPDSDPLTVTGAVQATSGGANALTLGVPFTTSGGGELTLNADGSWGFDPGNAYNGLDDGETATEVVTYTIDDGNGGTDEATLTITINGANDAPVIVDPNVAQPDPSNPVPADPATVIPTQNVDDGEAFTPAAPLIDVSDYAIDPDGNPDQSALTFTTASPLPTGLTLNADGTVTGIIDKDASQGGDDPAVNPGVYTIAVTVDDGTATAIVTLTIDVSNPAPVAVDDVATADEDTIQQGNVLTDLITGDADGTPDKDPLTITAITTTNGDGAVGQAQTLTYGDLVLNADGAWTFTPNLAANALPFGVNVAEQITYTIDDGNGGTDEATLTVNITGVNDAPIIVDPANLDIPPVDPASVVPIQLAEDASPITPVDITPYFADPDGDSLQISIDPADLPPGLGFNPVTGVISGTPTHDASQGGPAADGTYPIKVTAIDPHGAIVTTIVTFEISNPPPVAVDDAAELSEGGSITIPVLNNDFDPDGDPLEVISAKAGNGTITINPDGTLTYKPNPGYAGDDNITYVISDGNGGFATASITITINSAGTNIVQQDQIDNDPALNNKFRFEDDLEILKRDPFELEIIHEFIRLVVEGRLEELELQFGLGKDNTLVIVVKELTRVTIENGSTVREMLADWNFWRELQALDVSEIFQTTTLWQDLKSLEYSAQNVMPLLAPDIPAAEPQTTTALMSKFSNALRQEKIAFESAAGQLANDVAIG